MAESRSWGHAVYPMSAEARASDDRYLARPAEWIGSWVTYPHHYPHCRCRGGKLLKGACHDRREFVAAYSYVTGRGGRVGRAERTVCRRHAEQFAKKHGLAMPSAVEV